MFNRKNHILTSRSISLTKGPSLFRNAAMKNRFHLVNYNLKQWRWIIRKSQTGNQQLWQHVKLYQEYVFLNYAKVLVLLENRHSWRETLRTKLVIFDNFDKITIALPYFINLLNALMPDISTLVRDCRMSRFINYV